MEGARTLAPDVMDDEADGLESEDTGYLEVEPKPWDPEKIRVNTKHYSLRQVVDMIADGEIKLAPDFQRGYVWKETQRDLLIESILLGIPLPSFYFDEDASGQIQVVDGVQRLTTIYHFVRGASFALGKVTYLKSLEGCRYEDLEPVYRRRMQSTQFVVHVIDPQTPYQVKFDIFRRINTGGVPLTAQEIRHCISRDRSRGLLGRLVDSEAFKRATDDVFKSNTRMADREVALRFCGFRITTPAEYAQFDNLDAFLGDVTKRIDEKLTSEQIAQLEADLELGMENARAAFGTFAFRKWTTTDECGYFVTTVAGAQLRPPYSRFWSSAMWKSQYSSRSPLR